MKAGPSRFDYFLDQLTPLLNTAAMQKDPASWLYRNNARTPLFMLEALAKIYAGMNNEKKFSRIKEHFKSLEDGLGAIDYYDATAKELATNKKVPVTVIHYLQAECQEKIQDLNKTLADKGWLLTKNNRVSKIKKKLNKAGWLKEAEEVKKCNEFYGEAIYKIVAFSRETNYRFVNIETEIHELRRRLRWLSIYPQALRGAIQLNKKKPIPAHLKKYATKAVVDSPFNKLPPPGELNYTLLLESSGFYALSWLIAELGNIKDAGLNIVALKEALQQDKRLSDKEAYGKIYSILGKQQPTLQDLLDKAGKICKIFFTEQNLEHLVIGTSGTKIS